MFQSKLLWGGLASAGLLLTAVVAQEAARAPAADQPEAAPPKVRAGALAPGDAPGRDAAIDPASMKATDHFLAGYYAGYGDGYLDGGEDTAADAVERQEALAARHAADGWHPDRMQPGRRQARESLRTHMRGEDDPDAPSEAKETGPSETIAGTVIGVKTVPIVGTRIVHRVVRIEAEDGRRRVADLGPTDQTEALDIKEGDNLIVEGVPVMTADMRITAGRRISKGDQEARVSYPKLNVTDEEGTQTPRAAEVRPQGSETPQPDPNPEPGRRQRDRGPE